MATTKHLSYAGITLPLPTPQLESGWLAKVHSPYDYLDLDGWNFDAPSTPDLSTPSIPKPPEFRFNRLYWPTGASNPAWFHCIVEDSRLTAIKSAIGSTAVPADLVMYDGRSGKTVTASMRMLPERPCNVTVGSTSNKFWILTLTDNRFFWYYRRGVVTAPTSWENLYSQLASIIGQSVTPDTVSSNYGTPSTKWVQAYRSTPALLDAVAAQVGQRVVVGLDGTVTTVNANTARDNSDAYFDTADPVISGGRLDTAGIARSAPASVRTVFGDASTGVLSSTPYTVTNTLVSLAISDYGSATGVSGYTETLFADAAYTGGNAAALALYAAQSATDWYEWFLTDADVSWPGIEPWVPTGWEDRVEWTMTITSDGPVALTTVRRGPFRAFTGGDYAAGYAQPQPAQPTIVTNICPQFATGIVITANYTVDPAFTQLVYIHASAQSGPITVTLFPPNYVTRTGVYSGMAWADRYVVKKVDATANVVTVVASGGALVEFATGVSLSTQGSVGVFYHDPSNWYRE